MALGVFLGHAEVHVEEQELALGRGFRALAREDLRSQSMWTSLSYFGRRSTGRSGVGRPGREAVGVDADVLDAELGQARGDGLGIVGPGAVDDDVPPGDDALLVEDAADLGLHRRW